MKPETKYVTVEVDGKPYSLPTDKPLLYALLDLGFDVPYFCSHKWLEPLGACRMCLVKLEEGGRMYPKLQIACATYAKEGMRVWLEHEEVLLARKEQLEFHLLNHPLECPVCDKGGECMLQDLTFAHGWDEGRFIEQKRIKPDKAMNDYIRLNYKRCIHCKRCINFTDDIDQTHLLKFLTRGAEMWIEGYPEAETAPRFSGNVIDMCPVGALTARSYRFMGRPWEQQLTASIGSLDSVGANIWLSGRLGEVARIIPRDNPDVENGLIDDVTRFSWECIDDADRLRKAVVGGRVFTPASSAMGHGGMSGSEMLQTKEIANFSSGCRAAAEHLRGVIGEHGPDSVGVIADNNLNTEEYLALRRLALEVLDTSYFHFGEEVTSLGPANDVAGALTSHTGSISQILHASTVLTVGTDLFEEAPSLGLWLDVHARRGQIKLLNVRSHGSGADSGATFLLCSPDDLLNRIQELQSEVGEVGEDCAILFGHEVWSHPQVAEIILALDRLRSVLVSGGKNVWLNPVYQGANSAGAMLVNELQDFGSAPAAGGAKARRGLTQILEAAAQGKLKALLVVDADILNTYPDRKLVERALHSAQTVAYCGPFVVPTAQYADVLLPLGTWAHREGTVVSLEWRVQKRLPGQIDSVSPSALDLANNLANHLSKTHIAADIGELYLQLGERVANWPLVPFVDFPQAGVRFAPQGHQGQAGNSDGTPAVVAPAKTGAGLRLIRKRFLYNDRQEIVNSPVFGQVWKPFCAFVNPADAQELKLNGGEVVRLGSGNSTLELPVKLASWVIPGTVIINDLCHAQPANTLAGAVNVTLEKTGKTVDPATVGMKNGGHAPSLPTIDTMNSMAASGGAE